MKIDLEKEFPNIYSKIDKQSDDFIDELRYFVVVDENYEDFDDEENDVFDPNDYNYLVYITERTSNIIGKENLKKLYESLDNEKAFENFLASEEDLYGLKSNLNDIEIARLILNHIDNILSNKES